jgi:hypothetical protein
MFSCRSKSVDGTGSWTAFPGPSVGAGWFDPRIRLSVNIVGAPALEAEPFQEYIQSHPDRTIVGAALAVRLPLGEYRDDQLINLGDNRFAFEPQLGVVQTFGPWSVELTGSVFIYTDNPDFFNGSRVERDPIYSVQGHVVRTIEGGFWLSAGVSWGLGGESEVNGVRKDDERSNLLYGVLAGASVGTATGSGWATSGRRR